MKKVIIFDFSGTLVKMRPPELLANKNILRALSKKYYLAIITGARKSETLNILNKLAITNLFALITTKDDTTFRKPDSILFNVVKETFRAKGYVYIGDTRKDYYFAKNSRIPFLYVGKRNIGIINNVNTNYLMNFLLYNFPDNI